MMPIPMPPTHSTHSPVPDAASKEKGCGRIQPENGKGERKKASRPSSSTAPHLKKKKKEDMRNFETPSYISVPRPPRRLGDIHHMYLSQMLLHVVTARKPILTHSAAEAAFRRLGAVKLDD